MKFIPIILGTPALSTYWGLGEMELDLKMSGMLVEMLRTKSSSTDSCSATFDAQQSPSTSEPVDVVRSDNIGPMPEAAKDSTSGNAALEGGERCTHNHE